MDIKKLNSLLPSLQRYEALNGAEISRIEFYSSSLFPLYKAKTSSKDLAIKVLDSFKMAESESHALIYMQEQGAFVPYCYGFFSQAEKYYLVMDFIEGGGRRSEDSIYNSLFSLYRNTSTHWGWKEHNYIGNIYQTNRLSESFREYWLAYRIEPLIRLAEQKGELDSSLAHKLIQLIDHLIEIWKLEKLTPRLIHGDLWSGNAIAGKEGKLYLIDPCLAFGHPEQDFGMMRMFGGFPGSSWMKRLGDSLSLDPELEERIPFWQIYPVLVHIVIFGRSYLSSLNTIIRAYS